MNNPIREDIIEKYDESKYGELKIDDVLSYESLSSPKLTKLKKSKSDSDIYEYFRKQLKRSSTQFIQVKKLTLPFYILNSTHECIRCLNKINIIDYKISIVCPLCYAHTNKLLKNFIIK